MTTDVKSLTTTAQEQVLDMLAARLAIDPLEFRIHNALADDTPTVTGQILGDGVGIRNRQPHQLTQERRLGTADQRRPNAHGGKEFAHHDRFAGMCTDKHNARPVPRGAVVRPTPLE